MNPHSFLEMINAIELNHPNNFSNSSDQQKNHEQGKPITLEEYQSQYKKNYEIMKNKYKKTLVPSLSFEEIVKCVLYLNKYAFFNG